LVIDRNSKIDEECKRILYHSITRPDDDKLYPTRLAIETAKAKSQKRRGMNLDRF
jgi:hypothetical protein